MCIYLKRIPTMSSTTSPVCPGAPTKCKMPEQKQPRDGPFRQPVFSNGEYSTPPPSPRCHTCPGAPMVPRTRTGAPMVFDLGLYDFTTSSAENSPVAALSEFMRSDQTPTPPPSAPQLPMCPDAPRASRISPPTWGDVFRVFYGDVHIQEEGNE